MGDLGLPGSVVEITDAAQQKALWEVRKAGLNIMMSMKGDGKPVSFIEDCAVPLEHLAEYTDRLTQVFAEARHARHLVRACLRRHAACAAGARHAPRRRRENARHRRGSLRDGEAVQGRLLRRARRRPGALGMDRAVLRPAPDRGAGRDQVLARPEGPDEPGQDRRALEAWTTSRCSASSRATRPRRRRRRSIGREWGGFDKAVEMCNNNGHCRKFDAGTMCPSYRVTRDEKHLTRGRANTLRLALSGQLGAGLRCAGQGGAGSVRVLQGLQARMPDRRRHGAHEDRVQGAVPARATASRCASAPIAYLPRYAPLAAGSAALANLASGWLARFAGFTDRAPAARLAATTISSTGPGRKAANAKWCCWSTPSTATSSPRTRAPPSACCRPADYRVHIAQPQSGETAAVLRPHVPVGGPGGGSARRGEAHAGGAGALGGARHPGRSGSNRPACSPCATSTACSCRAREALGEARFPVRGISRRAKPRPAASS